MKFSLSIFMILFCANISAEDLKKAEQIAKAGALCDEKVMQLCRSASVGQPGEMRSCVKDSIEELDAECRLLIDKEMRKGTLIQAKSAKSGKRFNFPDTPKKNN